MCNLDNLDVPSLFTFRPMSEKCQSLDKNENYLVFFQLLRVQNTFKFNILDKRLMGVMLENLRKHLFEPPPFKLEYQSKLFLVNNNER